MHSNPIQEIWIKPEETSAPADLKTCFPRSYFMAISILPSRSQTALIMAGAFIVLTVTGLVMFLWPPREIAIATHYSLLGMGKGGWEAIHLGLSFTFIALGSVHIWWNRRALTNYVTPSKDKTTLRRIAITLALMIASGFFGAWIA
jgi:hypothetical protein